MRLLLLTTALLATLGLSASAFAQPLATQQLVLDDGTADDAIGDGGQFLWFNRFTPPASDYPLEVTHVQVVLGTTLVTVGDPIDIYLWEDTDGDGDPATGANLLASFSETVQFNDQTTFSEYTLDTPVRFETPGDVLIGVVNRAGAEGINDFPAGIDTGASMERSWVGSWLAGDVPETPTLPADEQWGTIDSFGLPGNWMIRGTYEEMVVSNENEVPASYELSKAFPNPFNPSAQFTLQVEQTQEVHAVLLDVLGRQVATLFDGTVAAGQRTAIQIDGAGLPSGVYTYQVIGSTFQDIGRVTLAK